MYYEYNEAVRSLVSHRILALNRGEKEDVLRVAIEPPSERILAFLQKQIIKTSASADETCSEILQKALEDSYKRLIQPSIEREISNQLKETAEIQTIDIFSENLKNKLQQTPIKTKTVREVDE